MADFGTFQDINHFLGRVKSLNLFLRHVISSVDVVKGLEEAIRNKSLLKITTGMFRISKYIAVGACLGLQGPLEANPSRQW
jgi:hypothetical protein